MPVLSNPRHELFAQELARGRSASQAYVVAGYEENRGNATRLKADESVSARVTELQTAGAERAVLTEEWVLSRLMANAERAAVAEPVLDREGKPTGEFVYDGAVVNRALELLGKKLGLFVDKTENVHTIRDITDEPVTESDWNEQHVTAH